MNLHKLKIQNKKICYEGKVVFSIYVDNLGQIPINRITVLLTSLSLQQRQMMLFMLKNYLTSVGYTSYNQPAKCLNSYFAYNYALIYIILNLINLTAISFANIFTLQLPLYSAFAHYI